MKAQQSEPIDPVSVIGFKSGLKMACDKNAIHESTEIWIVPHFMKRTATAELTARPSLKSKSSKKKTKESIFPTFSHAVN